MQKKALVSLLLIVLVLVILLGIGHAVVAPNSDGLSGLFRRAVLQTENLAFTCDDQVEKGEEIFADTHVELAERASLSREWFTMALSCQDPVAHYYIGYFYLNGYGVKQNVDKGMAYLKEARLAGSRAAAATLARAYHRGDPVNQDIEAAVSNYEMCAADKQSPQFADCGAGLARLLVFDKSPPEYKQAYGYAHAAAEAGSSLGQSMAAFMLYEGLGVTRDVEKARLWAERSAENDEALSYGTLAKIYLRGDGVPADAEKGREYLQRLEKIDAPWAYRQLGEAYQSGLGSLPRDSSKSLAYFLKASKKGDAKAAREVGRYYFNHIDEEDTAAEAFRWLSRASKKGDTLATLYLSRLYFKGVPALNLSPSKDKGWSYLNKADKMGEIAAKADLAYQFYEGGVVTRNYEDALQYAREGAEGGDAHSQAWLGFFLQGGIGTDKDPELALHWLDKAAEQEDSWGMFQLAESYFHGIGVPVDRKKARELFTRALQLGNVDAAMYLGYYFERALEAGSTVDMARAHAYYNFAAQNGSVRGEEARRRTLRVISAAELEQSEALQEEIQSSLPL